MGSLGSHTKGDGWDGHLWVFIDPTSGEPLDLTGWSFEFYAKAKRSDEDPVWSLSTENEDEMNLVYGEGQVITRCDGSTFTFAEAGYPYGVKLEPVVPTLGVGEWYWGLRGTPPGGLPKTYEQGRISITWEDS